MTYLAKDCLKSLPLEYQQSKALDLARHANVVHDDSGPIDHEGAVSNRPASLQPAAVLRGLERERLFIQRVGIFI